MHVKMQNDICGRDVDASVGMFWVDSRDDY